MYLNIIVLEGRMKEKEGENFQQMEKLESKNGTKRETLKGIFEYLEVN